MASVGAFHSVNRSRIFVNSVGPYQTWGGVTAADDVGHKKYGESCPWFYGRSLIGGRTAAGSSVGCEIRFAGAVHLIRNLQCDNNAFQEDGAKPRHREISLVLCLYFTGPSQNTQINKES